jgi:hypothetical protein
MVSMWVPHAESRLSKDIAARIFCPCRPTLVPPVRRTDTLSKASRPANWGNPRCLARTFRSRRLPSRIRSSRNGRCGICWTVLPPARGRSRRNETRAWGISLLRRFLRRAGGGWHDAFQCDERAVVPVLSATFSLIMRCASGPGLPKDRAWQGDARWPASIPARLRRMSRAS